MLNNTNTLVKFCEKKYIYSNYIAEFYNTISNIFYLIFGIYWLYIFNKNNIVGINCFCYSTIFLGIGSILFHSTSNYYMELVDEFSMFLLNILILDRFNKLYNSNKNKTVTTRLIRSKWGILSSSFSTSFIFSSLITLKLTSNI